jgi:hypothetical protein
MKVIYKYGLPVLEKFTIELPAEASIIRVDDVDGKFWLWAVVDNEAPTEQRFIECYKTGQSIETPLDELRYLGCCKLFIMQELCLYMFENVAKRPS